MPIVNNIFIFGGIIAETKITIKGTEIEVVQSPLDRTGAIADRDASGGRFIITTVKYLDPLIFRQGRDIRK
jgi:outer membrane lipoprotein